MAKCEKGYCFVMSPIGKEGTSTRERSDRVFKYILTPPVEGCGYMPIRADKIGKQGNIVDHIKQHLEEDPLAIADLTDRNPNVLWELGYRRRVGKNTIQIIERGQEIPLDVSLIRTIEVDYQDLCDVDLCRQEIIRQIISGEHECSPSITSDASSREDRERSKIFSFASNKERSKGIILPFPKRNKSANRRVQALDERMQFEF